MNKRESKEQAEERAQVAPPWSHRHSLGALAPEGPNVYRSRDENCLALRRSAMYWSLTMSSLSFRSIGAKKLLNGGTYKHSVPPGLSNLQSKSCCKPRLHLRPLFRNDAEADGIANAPIGHDQMVAKYAFLSGA